MSKKFEKEKRARRDRSLPSQNSADFEYQINDFEAATVADRLRIEEETDEARFKKYAEKAIADLQREKEKTERRISYAPLYSGVFSVLAGFFSGGFVAFWNANSDLKKVCIAHFDDSTPDGTVSVPIVAPKSWDTAKCSNFAKTILGAKSYSVGCIRGNGEMSKSRERGHPPTDMNCDW